LWCHQDDQCRLHSVWRTESNQIMTRNAASSTPLTAKDENLYFALMFRAVMECHDTGHNLHDTGHNLHVLWISVFYLRDERYKGLTVRGSNLSRDEIFRTRPDRPWGQPNLLYNGYWVIPGVKRPGRGANHISHLAPRLKKE
jgi:hypothetical protein